MVVYMDGRDAGPRVATACPTDANQASDVEYRLEAINRRLSGCVQADPLDLTTGAGHTLADPLWVWGVFGGKEVGKTTFINALAGDAVADPGALYGEGTFRPTVYFHGDDAVSLSTRFESLRDVDMTQRSVAPDSMRGLVLVDLPDFDSLFTRHAEQVRRVGSVLDGIIWITTPKKVGDLAGIREIERVLKSRTNFLYVVNKMDWLIAQSDSAPEHEISRMRDALAAQIGAVDLEAERSDVDDERSFLITAKHRTRECIVAEINAFRNDGARFDSEVLMPVADDLLRSFERLRRTLTTPPTREVAAANKHANLRYQSRVQVDRLRAHYQPEKLLDRLERAASAAPIGEIVSRSFPDVYVRNLQARAFEERGLLPEWSSTLFRTRIAYWSLIGVIAWPVLALGALISRLRPGSALVDLASPERDAFFRFDGLSLIERAEAVCVAVDVRLGALARKLRLDLPDASEIADRFQADATSLIRRRGDAMLGALVERRPTIVGRFFRAMLPVAILLWFPLVQPIGSAVLDVVFEDGFAPSFSMVRAVVGALSASDVLSGVCASLVLFGAVVGGIYAGCARDAQRMIQRLQDATDDFTDPLREGVVHAFAGPVMKRRDALVEISDTLGCIAGGVDFSGNGNGVEHCEG